LFARAYWIVNYGPENLGFRAKLSSGGGIFQDVGSHFIDLCRWLFDGEIVAVQGLIDMGYPKIMEVEDHAVATLEFQDGTSALIETSWIGPSSRIHEHLEETWIYGTEGAIKVNFPSNVFAVPRIEVWSKKSREWRTLPLPPFDRIEFMNCHYKRMLDEFVSCVREKRQFYPTGEDGKKAIEVVLGLYQSWYEGRKTHLPLKKRPDVTKIFASLRQKSLARVNAITKR
jgi:predicted dehydrogenase